ncbi:hypothetical protein [Halomonas sp. Cn5-12]|uniref:hypothetical protein n=1 Tax=Halomonas sp. Cn5-12 TaxID=2908885 RepID=UPI001F1F87F0|nr:hypothetical protein [Halomonas sp. Cn5-12]MCF2911886.1 hypothetical protein [Halomonas sp. Cn5-12]
MLRAVITIGAFLSGIAIGIAWANDQTLVSKAEAKNSVEQCSMYFAENAPTSLGVEVGVAMCRQASY